MLHFFTQTIGRLHPLLVHLPIGILLLSALFYFLSRKPRFNTLDTAVSISLLIGFLTALLSVITGYGLSLNGDYADTAVAKHQWAGIVTVALTGLVWYLRVRKNTLEMASWFLMLAGLFLTGHWGGSLTHGEGYLGGIFRSGEDSLAVYAPKPIPDIEEAIVYTDMIQPILEARCYSCHGPNKQKGKLRLDQPDLIIKGGEEGKVISPGNPEQSALVERLFLPAGDKDHMPPREKPQPGSQELALLHWWVKNGGSFTQKVKEAKKDEKIGPVLAFFREAKPQQAQVVESYLPVEQVPAADTRVLKALFQKGWSVVSVAQGSQFLIANAIGTDTLDKEGWELLEKISPQLFELKLGYSKVRDADLSRLAVFRNLSKLSLNNTAVSDKGLSSLQGLTRLKYLNLSQTNVTPSGLRVLSSLKELHQLYLYREGISGKEWLEKGSGLRNVIIDTGGYKVPTLASDTVELTAPRNN